MNETGPFPGPYKNETMIDMNFIKNEINKNFILHRPFLLVKKIWHNFLEFSWQDFIVIKTKSKAFKQKRDSSHTKKVLDGR